MIYTGELSGPDNSKTPEKGPWACPPWVAGASRASDRFPFSCLFRVLLVHKGTECLVDRRVLNTPVDNVLFALNEQENEYGAEIRVHLREEGKGR